MVDLHSHVLPGIDDGAPDLNVALELARAAIANGITHIVCTPHIHPGRYDNSPEIINSAHRKLLHAIADEQLALEIAAAAEVRFGIELIDAAQQGTLPFLGQWHEKPVLLLEFPPGEIPYGAERLTEWLVSRGIVPMIAHPERNKAVLRNPARLKPFLQQGCMLQVTAGSVAGRFGRPCQDLSNQLLTAEVVTVLATDTHNLDHRPPDLYEGMACAATVVGDVMARRLVEENPWEIAQFHFCAPAQSRSCAAT